MFLTTAEFQQLNNTRLAMGDGLRIVENFMRHNVIDPVLVALTSKQAIATYRLFYHTLMLTAAAAYFSGVLARHGWEWFVQWAEQYVASCQEVPVIDVEPKLEFGGAVQAVEAIATIPTSPTVTPAEESIVPITNETKSAPMPSPEPVVKVVAVESIAQLVEAEEVTLTQPPQGRKRRGRPRKTAA